MVSGFTTVIQKDIVRVIRYVDNKDGYRKNITNSKILFPVTRILSTVGMAAGLVTAFRAMLVGSSSTASILFQLAYGISLYAVSHDVFVMTRNATILAKIQEQAGIEVLLGDPTVVGTHFHIFWNHLIDKVKG